AQRLGWSKRSVKDRLERGRNRLRSRLVRCGVTLPAALTGTLLAFSPSSAVVPASLTETTLRAALPFALRQPLPDATSPPALALAEGGLQTMALSKLVLVAAGLLLLVGISSAGWWLGQPEREAGPQPAVPVQADHPVLLDRHGDPLPPGAVARLGTVR